MSDSCPVLTAKGSAFECLQEEDDEEEKASVFQSEKSLYGEKERVQREHAEQKKRKAERKAVDKCPRPKRASNRCYRLGAATAASDQTRACESQQEIQKKALADDEDRRSRPVCRQPQGGRS